MLAAFRGEMFKVARRPAVWVCIILLVLLAVLLGYVLFGFIYSHPPKGSSQGLPCSSAHRWTARIIRCRSPSIARSTS